jgi:hypothetical protein
VKGHKVQVRIWIGEQFGSLNAGLYDEWTAVRVRDAVVRELAGVADTPNDAVRVYRATRAALDKLRDEGHKIRARDPLPKWVTRERVEGRYTGRYVGRVDLSGLAIATRAHDDPEAAHLAIWAAVSPRLERYMALQRVRHNLRQTQTARTLVLGDSSRAALAAAIAAVEADLAALAAEMQDLARDPQPASAAA